MFGKGLLATLGLLLSFNFFFDLAYSCLEHEGDQHRKQRKMLNPVFSVAHMRDMGENAFPS